MQVPDLIRDMINKKIYKMTYPNKKALKIPLNKLYYKKIK